MPESDNIKWHPGHYAWIAPNLFASSPATLGSILSFLDSIANEPTVKGIQIMGYWAEFEGATAGDYSRGFATLDAILARAALHNKHVILSVMPAIFGNYGSDWSVFFPAYLINQSQYGITVFNINGNGLQTRIWQTATTDRLNALAAAYGARYNSHPNFEMFTIGETSVNVSEGTDGYSIAALDVQLKRQMSAARVAFPNTSIRLGANWYGSDAMMISLLNYAAALKIAVGGPDTVPRAAVQSNQVFTGAVPGSTDLRGVVPFIAETQAPGLGGRVGTYTIEQLYLAAMQGISTNSGGATGSGTAVFRAVQPQYFVWFVNTYSGGAAQRWDTGILPFIRSINGAVFSTACPSSFGGKCSSVSQPPAPTKNNGKLQPQNGSYAIYSNNNNGALILDGVDDYISTPIQFLASEVAKFTVGVWVRTDDNRGRKIIGFEKSITESNYDRHLYVGTDGKLYFGIYNATEGSKILTSPERIDDNYWHYVVGSFENGVTKLYVDGVLVSQGTALSAEPFDGYWIIGGYRLSYWPNASAPGTSLSLGFLRGSIAAAHVYNRALSDAEVLSNYNVRKSRFRPSAGPTITATAISGSQIELTIDDAIASAPVIGYIIQRSMNSNGPWTSLANPTKNYVDSSGITSSTQYYYRAKFIQNDNKTSDFGSVINITSLTVISNVDAPTVDLTPISKSEIFADVIVPPTSVGQAITGYTVERSTTSTGPWINVGTTSAVMDSELSTNTTYYYRAKYNIGGGDSAYSPVVNASTFNPQPLTSQQLRDAGYVLVTDYGADPTGVTDSTTAIQTAIDSAQRRPVWFPSGTYTISDTIRCYSWEIHPETSVNTSRHTLIGAHSGERPKFKLAASAPLFDNLLQPRPMVSFINFRNTTQHDTSSIAATFTGSISGTTLTITSMLQNAGSTATGVIYSNRILTGTGVASGTTITGQLSGTTGGVGTYSVSISQTVASTTITSPAGAYSFTRPLVKNDDPDWARASALQTGIRYKITFLGNTNWSAIGASGTIQVGTEFTATGPGSGTGSAVGLVPTTYYFHPFQRPSGWRPAHGNLFDVTFCNIDLDTSGHEAAVGLHMPACQNSITNNVKVTATGSLCGFWHLPNAGSPTVNVEVVGGQYGIRFDSIAYFGGSAGNSTLLESGSGVTISGAKLTGQTVQCLVTADYCPLVIVGFDFQPAAGGIVWGPQGNLPSVSFGAMSTAVEAGVPYTVDHFALIDGKITQSSGIVFNNSRGRTIYLKNVYFSGTNTLTQYKTRTAISGTGTWKRITEYVSIKDGGYPYNRNQFESSLHHYSIIDNVVATGNTNPEPIISVQNNVSAPPSNLVTRHYPEQFPCVDNGPYVIVPFTPVPLSGPRPGSDVYPRDRTTGLPTSSWANVDNRAAVQTAIDQAQAAGHGRVFMGAGRVYIGAPLILRSKTKLMGTGLGKTRICAANSWVPTSGYAFMITTDNYKNATTSLSFLAIDTPRLRGPSNVDPTTGYTMYTGDRFSGIHWRAGRHSKIGHIYLEREYLENILRHPMNYMYVSNNGGGRFYGIGGDGRGNSGRKYRAIRMESTTEPTHFYGFNLEAGKSTSNLIFTPETNAELINCRNVRMYGTKREGDASTIIITDCDNIAYYSAGGAMLTPMRHGESPPAHIYIKGSSANIVVTHSQPQMAVDYIGYNIVDKTLPALSGTVTVSGTVVTGVGTTFTSSLSAGIIGTVIQGGSTANVRFNNSLINVGNSIREVVSITNNNQLTVNSAFSGLTTASYTAYPIIGIKHTEVLGIYKKGSPDDSAMF